MINKYNLYSIFFLLWIVVSCKNEIKKEDNISEGKIKSCSCTTPGIIGGYFNAEYTNDCSCSAQSGIFGCVIIYKCPDESMEVDIKENYSFGNPIAWDTLIGRFINHPNEQLKSVGKEAKMVKEYVFKEGSDLQVSKTLIYNLNVKFDTINPNLHTEILKIL